MMMEKKHTSKTNIFIALALILLMVNKGVSQTPKPSTPAKTNTSTNSKNSSTAKPQTPVVKKAPPVNTKTMKARGIIAADLDCNVKISTVPKVTAVTAFTPKVVILSYGLNVIEATSTDKEKPSTFKTTIDVKDTSRQIIEISFYDDNRFLDYIKQGMVSMVETAMKRNPGLAKNEDQTLTVSPLQIAIVYSQPKIAKLLTDKGASFLVPENIYPMHKAAVFATSVKEKGVQIAPDRELIDLFLSLGCKITDVDDGGNSLLHAAARGMKSELVRYLVEQGADVNAKNNDGDTPLKIAQDKGSVSIIEFLESKGAVEK